MIKPKVTITTDGGCDPNPGLGAWAAILRYGNACKSIVGSESQTTNNRMEMTAIIEAFSALAKPCMVTLRTDSQYCIWAIEAAKVEKKRNKWLRKGANLDLVQRLWASLEAHEVSTIWIKGHSGDPDNESVDTLCTAAIVANRQPRHA